ncbi:ribonuclease HII [Mangrovicoccus algicola]|uniref:Ribonuclease HII n=1 Tax=Mangrovicoccus algicola TaxID=2771008 RepID=A0A8J6YZN7_9RHOB|nr:ribonuclease HII [Mangrovicoccus algicola]MBE3638931.1 ribonuclease HII [Mangrovicoccus algicola]
MPSPVKPVPSFDPERQLCGDPRLIRIAGVDEVGRGPLAGPVTAAAVRLDPARVPAGLNDSKALNPLRREALAQEILATADVCIAHATVAEIDEINILQATFLAMRRAVAGLGAVPDRLLIDGNKVPPGLPCPAAPLVKGDAKSLSVAAASIVAKVARDAIMADLARECPGYGWERNAGYPTRAHVVALKSLGITPYHRRSFAPIHKILCGDTE